MRLTLTPRLSLVLLFIVLLSGLCREALSRTPPQESPIQVPIKTDEHGFIIVPVVVNHTVRGRFLLDTGTTDCLITERFAAKLKANPLATESHAGWREANGVRIRTVTLESVRFGGHTLGNIIYRGRRIENLSYRGQRLRDIVVGGYGLKDFEYGVVRASQINLGVDGILGLSALSNTVIAVFPRRHTMEIYPTGNMTPARRAAAGFGPAAVRLPLSEDKDEALYFCKVGFSSGGKTDTVDLLFDTGFDITSLPASVEKSLHLQPLHEGMTFTFNHQTASYDTVVPLMTVGDLKLSNQPVTYSLEPPKQGKADNSLGIDVFKGYSLLIDFPASVVYLSPIL